MKQGTWKSRKLLVAVVAVVTELALAFGANPEVAGSIGQMVGVVASAYLLGQSWADGRAQNGGGK